MTKEITKEELKEIQIGILKKIVAFCHENKLRCWLWYGTLLGAVRHKGFIPWDDDIDLAMPREDYTSFLTTFPQDERFGILSLVTSEKYCYNHTKVYDKRTIVTENITVRLPLGVNVDIFPLDNLPDNPRKLKRLVRRVGFWQKILWLKLIRFKKGRALGKTLVLVTGKILALPFSVWGIAKRIDRIAQSYFQKKDSMRIGDVSTMTYGEREIMKREWFTNDVDLEFEGQLFPAPQGWDAILTQVYGDYMTPPPEDKRNSSHDCVATWKSTGNI